MKMIIANWKSNGSKALIDALRADLTKIGGDLTKVDGDLTKIGSGDGDERATKPAVNFSHEPMLRGDLTKIGSGDEDERALEQPAVNFSHEFILCPPSPLLSYAATSLLGLAKIGAQDCATAANCTGDVPCSLLAEFGVRYVIVGHSERRAIYKESDELVAKKVDAVLRGGSTATAIRSSFAETARTGVATQETAFASTSAAHHLTAIVCVGESLQEREAGGAFDAIARQLALLEPFFCAGREASREGVANLGDGATQEYEASLDGATQECEAPHENGHIANPPEKPRTPPCGSGRIIIAYEPIWAIGANKTPTPDEICAVHSFISEKTGCRVIYGGGVTLENYQAILRIHNVAGVLVGRESLSPHFYRMVMEIFDFI
jgi:triosephosphate isomerase